MLIKLNKNSCAVNMKILEKCEHCKLYITYPHCAADCVNENDMTLTKTTSVCNYTRLQVYFARKYWEKIKQLHPSLYKKYKITWTSEEQEELLSLVLNEVFNLKNKEKKMIIANLAEMLIHKFDEVYEYKKHQWVNEQLNCGCIIAICVDIEPTHADIRNAENSFIKIASLETYLK